MTTHFSGFEDVGTAATIRVLPRKQVSGFYGAGCKRLLDILFVIVMAPIALPVILISALIVSLDGHSPFYRQRRVGRGGEVFSILKLRTMVPDADAALRAHLDANPDARAEWERKQKLCNDPRITKLGVLLRKTSLDELPQLWNVLIGDMSVVGPRPMLPDQRAIYPSLGYYDLRPGITGLWQVSERNDCSFAERAALDDAYINNLSLRMDLGILVRTVGVVIRCTGY